MINYHFRQELMEDIHIAERLLWTNFCQLLNQNKYDEAHQILTSNPSLIGKIFNAEKINKQSDGLKYIENNIKDGVDGFLERALEGQGERFANFEYIGEFDISSQYLINNIVSYQHKSYLSLANQKGIAPDINSTSWVEFDFIGDTGYGSDLTYAGTFQSGQVYEKNNVVTSEDGKSLYIAKDGNQNIPLTNMQYWILLFTVSDDIEKFNLYQKQAELKNLTICGQFICGTQKCGETQLLLDNQPLRKGRIWFVVSGSTRRTVTAICGTFKCNEKKCGQVEYI